MNFGRGAETCLSIRGEKIERSDYQFGSQAAYIHFKFYVDYRGPGVMQSNAMATCGTKSIPEKILEQLGDVYITVEGGPGVAQEARCASARGADIIRERGIPERINRSSLGAMMAPDPYTTPSC